MNMNESTQRHFPYLDEMDGLEELLGKWEILSSNLGMSPPKTPILLPDLFVVSESESMISSLVEGLTDYLQEAGNLMEFYGDVPAFEFRMDYCPGDRPFTELLRFMDEVSEYAGYRDVFKGLVHIDIDAWLGHQEEHHFLDLMDYLAENTGNWLILLSVRNRRPEQVSSLEAMLSMFLRIEKLTLNMASAESCLKELSARIGQYGFTLDESAEGLLLESIEVLRKSRFFDASYSMGLLCGDIVYETYSRNLKDSRVLGAEDLAGFAADSNYIRRTVKRIRESRAIGFV